jgi:hypothetical protein
MPLDADLLMVSGQVLAGLAYLVLTLRLLWQRGQQTEGHRAMQAILPATLASVGLGLERAVRAPASA